MNIIILNDRRIEFVGEISFEKFDSFLSIFEYDSNIEKVIFILRNFEKVFVVTKKKILRIIDSYRVDLNQ